MRSNRACLAAAAAMLAAIVLSSASCASMKARQEWTGLKIDQAIAELGNPSSVLLGQDGKKTYIFTVHQSVPVETVTFNTQGAPISGSAFRDSVRTWTMSVDASGIITTWHHSETTPTM